jgi:diguanylate cyclase (GGDEF)-like protein/PAS domain S-box-containing protein
MQSNSQCAQMLAAILASADEAIVGMTLEGVIQLWSSGAERLYGYSAEEVTGQSLLALLPIYEVPALQEVLQSVRDGRLLETETVERLHKFGSRINVAVRRSVVRDEHGAATSILESGRAIWHNVPDKPLDRQLRQIVEQMPLILWTTDQQLRITSNWGSGLQHTELQAGELIGRPVSEYLKCAGTNMTPMAHHYAALRGESVQFDYKRKDRILEIHLEPLRSPLGEIVGCIGVGLDITQRKRSEEQIRYQATHDALTGLANFREFMDTLERELRRAERSHHSFTVLLLDLDDLKRINDRFGHLAGNRALKRLAVVMKGQCRATDLAARYGGDEFAVILIDSDQGMAQQVAQRIEACVRGDQEEPQISVSIGMAVYPTDGRTAQDLLEVADQQLYGRKKKVQGHKVTAS